MVAISSWVIITLFFFTLIYHLPHLQVTPHALNDYKTFPLMLNKRSQPPGTSGRATNKMQRGGCSNILPTFSLSLLFHPHTPSLPHPTVTTYLLITNLSAGDSRSPQEAPGTPEEAKTHTGAIRNFMWQRCPGEHSCRFQR